MISCGWDLVIPSGTETWYYWLQYTLLQFQHPVSIGWWLLLLLFSFLARSHLLALAVLEFILQARHPQGFENKPVSSKKTELIMLSLGQHRPLQRKGWASVLFPHKQARCLHVFRYITDKRKKQGFILIYGSRGILTIVVGEWHGGKGRKPASHRIGSQESGVGVGGEQEV